MHLALACGRADVDQFLEELPREQFEEWLAYYELLPFDTWQHTASLLAMLHNMLVCVASWLSGKRIRSSELKDTSDFYPLGEAEKPKYLDPLTEQHLMEALYAHHRHAHRQAHRTDHPVREGDGQSAGDHPAHR